MYKINLMFEILFKYSLIQEMNGILLEFSKLVLKYLKRVKRILPLNEIVENIKVFFFLFFKCFINLSYFFFVF